MTSRDFFDSFHALSDDEKIERIIARAYDYPTKISDFNFLVDHLDNDQTADDLLWFCCFFDVVENFTWEWDYIFDRMLESNLDNIIDKLQNIGSVNLRATIKDYIISEISLSMY